MLKLDDEQRSTLRFAVERATQLEHLPAALDVIYNEFQTQLNLRKPKCSASGRCCRFEEYGHRLFVSTIELALFKLRMTSGRTDWDGSGCPFQIDGLCSVHHLRPFGCRIYFCDPTSIDWQSDNYERFHARIKALHEAFGVEYLYVEWREGLEAIEMTLLKANRLQVLRS